MISKRFGISSDIPIKNDFPMKSRTALSYVFQDLSQRYYIQQESIVLELNRIGRFTKNDLNGINEKGFINQVGVRLAKIKWHEVFVFCERVYEKYLQSCGWESNENYVSLEEARNYYSKEINQILQEDNISFYFKDGLFQREGHSQTMKSIERAGLVLSDPKLDKVKKHFNKAIRFFNNRPEADKENCIKEAICALEACVEILTGKKVSSDFGKVINQLKGNNDRQIPPPIAECIIKIHSYRGSGEGVAHAALQGNRVLMEDTELVLSLVASFITYLVSLFKPVEDIPF